MNCSKYKWMPVTIVLAWIVMFSIMGEGHTLAKGPPSSNPGQPFAEMAAQHDMIKDDIAAAQAAIQTDLTTLQEAVEALEGNMGQGPPCGPGTSGQQFVTSQDGTEVCDNRTGLHWQQSPDATLRTQTEALAYCPTLGNGYRLPEVQERIGVLNYTQFMPALTPGVFGNIQSLGYWTATNFANNFSQAWAVDNSAGVVLPIDKTQLSYAWCVR